ncbi:MAG TPA: hypothetical protein PKH58_13110 [Paludibacteraceae bacterium]|nr:hypothetical protein [Paludibacteraceae bacterium]
MFNVNLNSIITWLLPTFLRGATLIAILKALLHPLQSLHFLLDAFRIQKQYELSITSQVIWLEKMLNTIFDPLNELIYIQDVGAVNQVYMSNKAESPHPRYLYNKAEAAYPTYIYNKSEDIYQFNFTVMVPLAIYNNLLLNNNSGLNQMKANLNKYKMFGTIYIIQSY